MLALDYHCVICESVRAAKFIGTFTAKSVIAAPSDNGRSCACAGNELVADVGELAVDKFIRRTLCDRDNFAVTGCCEVNRAFRGVESNNRRIFSAGCSRRNLAAGNAGNRAVAVQIQFGVAVHRRIGNAVNRAAITFHDNIAVHNFAVGNNNVAAESFAVEDNVAVRLKCNRFVVVEPDFKAVARRSNFVAVERVSAGGFQTERSLIVVGIENAARRYNTQNVIIDHTAVTDFRRIAVQIIQHESCVFVCSVGGSFFVNFQRAGAARRAQFHFRIRKVIGKVSGSAVGGGDNPAFVIYAAVD